MPRPVAAVDEERVVGLSRRLGDRECSGVGEPVRRADDEEVEGVLRVELDLRPLAEADVRVALSRARGERERIASAAGRAACSTTAKETAISRPNAFAGGGRHVAVEMALDPVPSEVVRDGHDQGLVAQGPRFRVREPGVVGGLADTLPKAKRDRVPETLSCRFRELVPPVAALVRRRKRTASIPPFEGPLNAPMGQTVEEKPRYLQELSAIHTSVHRCGRARSRLPEPTTPTTF